MTTSVLEDRRTVWVVAALSFLLFLIGNLPWQLDDYDQAKQAFTSFQMIKEGRWFYQQTPHEHVATKPPLIGWVSAALFSVTRSWDMAWRLPSLVCAIALALLLFHAATSAYGSTAGVISLGAFGLNLLSPRLATLVRTDMPLAFVIFLIGLLIWQKIREERQWRFRDGVYVSALLTAAMLIKGPIVYAFLLPGIIIFQIRYGRARPPQRVWPGWWPWIVSLAIFLLWVLGGIAFQPGFFDEVVMREFLGRFSETIHRPQPLYFYVAHLLHKFAPWSALMIVIGFAALHAQRWRLRSVLKELSPDTFWLLCWSFGGLIVMTLIPSKRVDRIFPVIPPLCLLLAAQISGWNAVPGRQSSSDRAFGVTRQRFLVIALLFAVLFTGGYTMWKINSGYRENRAALAMFGRNVCREAEAKHWRYEIVSARDEGLLLYLQKTHFTDPDRTVAEWNGGNLDALVASTEKAPALMRDLQRATISQLKSTPRQDDQGRSYVLITR